MRKFTSVPKDLPKVTEDVTLETRKTNFFNRKPRRNFFPFSGFKNILTINVFDKSRSAKKSKEPSMLENCSFFKRTKEAETMVPKKLKEMTLSSFLYICKRKYFFFEESHCAEKTVKPNLLSCLVRTKTFKTMVAECFTIWKHQRRLASKVGRSRKTL